MVCVAGIDGCVGTVSTGGVDVSTEGAGVSKGSGSVSTRGVSVDGLDVRIGGSIWPSGV